MGGLEHLLENLNGPQREAVVRDEKALLVLAGPGSGKTTVIVKRIQYLISQMHVPPEQILVITFTKDAARSMQQRFQRQSDQCLPVNFGTFHSVFYRILLQSAPHPSNASNDSPEISTGAFADTSIETSTGIGGAGLLTAARKKELIIPILKERKGKAGQSGPDADTIAAEAGEMLSAISFYKNTEDEAGAAAKLAPEWKPLFREVLAAYQGEVRKRKLLDFDDMVYECRRLLAEDRALREYWQKRFSHILIDEFQDINPLQYQVVKLLAGTSCSLFAVGDDDQAIYGFRGSRPACLRQFAEEFRAGQVLLNLNYRSRREIVEASVKVIGENRERFPKELSAAKERQQAFSGQPVPFPRVQADAGRPVRILRFEEREQQSAYLREQIEAFRKDFPEKSCAVLFRTNTFMQGFAAGLTKAGIPYAMREKAGNIYDHFIVRDVMAYLRFAAGERTRQVFLQIMNKPVRYLRRDALADAENVDFGEMARWYREYGGVRGPDRLDALDRLQNQFRAMSKMPPHLAVRYVCKAVGYEGYLRGRAAGEDKRQEWLELLEWLKGDARGYETVQAWLQAQRNYSPAGDGFSQNGAAANAVQLMTVHAAKGLEFHKVWIPDCNEKTFPHGGMPDRETVEEERRIFYVGMTRAKESLELLYLTGTRERPRLMSRFLNPIVEDYSSKSSSNSQLSRYSSKASATFSYSSSSSM